MRKSESQKGKSPSQMIDERIRELGDWRGKMLSQLRALIKQADPEVVEEWKWRVAPARRAFHGRASYACRNWSPTRRAAQTGN
jgi:hypothetical protein